MSSRERILGALRANRPAGAHDLPVLPSFAPLRDGPLLPWFADSLALMGGKLLPGGEAPEAALRALFPEARVIVSAAPELAGTRGLDPAAPPAALADVDVAVVRAACAVAETGSVLFTEAELGVNALAYLAQHLLVLLDPADLLPGLQELYRRPEFHAAHYVALHSGPSATADIEGVLIRGAQGVRSLTVLLCPRAG